MSKKADEYKIQDYDYVLSSLGNAYFSGLTFEELWESVTISDNREELDTAISASIRIKEIQEGK